MSTITTKHSEPYVRSLIAALVDSLAGRGNDPRVVDLVRGIKLRAGMVALSGIAIDFITKSEGGTGEDGITWKPLSQKTIAYGRRLGPGDPQPNRPSKPHGSRPYLSDVEDKRWRMLFATRKSHLMAKFGLSEQDASDRAAQSAWATLKAEGAKTKLAVLGNRKVSMLRDTGRLFNSLSPGVPDPTRLPLNGAPPTVEDQILRDEPGAVVVGTNVEYAAKQHAMRPFWRPDGSLPPQQQAEILEAVKAGIVEALAILLES